MNDVRLVEDSDKYLVAIVPLDSFQIGQLIPKRGKDGPVMHVHIPLNNNDTRLFEFWGIGITDLASFLGVTGNELKDLVYKGETGIIVSLIRESYTEDVRIDAHSYADPKTNTTRWYIDGVAPAKHANVPYKHIEKLFRNTAISSRAIRRERLSHRTQWKQRVFTMNLCGDNVFSYVVVETGRNIKASTLKVFVTMDVEGLGTIRCGVYKPISFEPGWGLKFIDTLNTAYGLTGDLEEIYKTNGILSMAAIDAHEWIDKNINLQMPDIDRRKQLMDEIHYRLDYRLKDIPNRFSLCKVLIMTAKDNFDSKFTSYNRVQLEQYAHEIIRGVVK